MRPKQARAVHLLRAIALCAAAGFIVLGICRGEAAVVLKKAIRICLECIGVA